MKDLKLCPFCGNEVDNHKDDCYFRLYSVAFADSLVLGKAGMHVHVSARELNEAWNTRAELPMAHMSISPSIEMLKEHGVVVDRACVPHVEPKTFTGDTEPSFYQAVCDCGWVVGEDGTSNLLEFEHVDNYCGGCGAKVVVE